MDWAICKRCQPCDWPEIACLVRSLCIIDEFGKGMLTTDGVGLLCGTLQRFARMRPPPKVIACTHFSEVLKEAYLPRCSDA